MSEFATSAALDVTVNPDSIRQARGTIEDGLNDVQVDVSNSTGGSSGGRMAGRERAMGRQLQTETNEHLSGIDSHWTENLDLNRERNDLLRQLVDVTEKDAQTKRGGRGGGLAGGAIGLAIGGIGLGSMLLDGLTSKLSDAIPDLGPGDIVNPVGVSVSDVVSSAASVTPAALVASTAAVAASDVIGSSANVSPGDVIAEAASLAPTDLIAEAATVSPATLVATAATVTVSSVIATAAEINPGDVISAAVDLVPEDIVSGTISASDIADRVTEPSPSPESDPTGSGDGALPWIGGGAAAAGVAAKQYGGQIISQGSRIAGQAAGRATSVTTPVITREMTGLGPNETPDPFNGGTKQTDLKSNKEWIRDVLSGPADPNAEPTAADNPNQWKTTPTTNQTLPLEDTGSGGNTTAKAEQTNHFEIIAPIDDLEREANEKFKELDRRLSKLENAFDG